MFQFTRHLDSKKEPNTGVTSRRPLEINGQIRAITAFVSKTEPKTESIVCDVLSEFCSNTSLHGVRYLGAKDHGATEK